MKPDNIIERTPGDYRGMPIYDEPLTIEYHFKDLINANDFKLPKELKNDYKLLEKTYEHIKTSMNYGTHSNPAIDYYYRIAQKQT